MANSTSKKSTVKAAPKPKVEKPVEVKAEPVVEEPKIEEEPKVEIPEEPVVEEEVKKDEPVEEPKDESIAPEAKKEEKPSEIQDGDVYIHNILGTENSKWEVRKKTAAGYKVLGKYAYEKAKHYASQFGPVKEA